MPLAVSTVIEILLAFALLACALIGHGFVWVAQINVTHAVRIPKWLCQLVSAAMFALGGALPLGYASAFWMLGRNPLAAASWIDLPAAACGYAAVCAALAPFAAARWAVLRRGRSAPNAAVRFDRRRALDLLPDPAERRCLRASAAAAVRLPGNEILELDLVERGLELTNLPSRLAGMSILHLSDFHLTGRIDRRYYERLVQAVNAQGCDLIALTGDLVDRPECIDWLPATLGRLRARHGAFFVLGNHDYEQDHAGIRKALVDCGLVDVGGVRREIELRGVRIVLAGDERPWFRHVPDATLDGAGDARERHDPHEAHNTINARGASDPRDPHSQGSLGRPLRLLLAHSPDRFGWAARAGFDLVLVGHTHAGQIQLPGIGPIFSPCVSGIRHVEGVYRRGATILHVTRGVSAKLPVRYLCRPEIVRLELCGPAGGAATPAAPAEETSRRDQHVP